jgi:hypothetical protein
MESTASRSTQDSEQNVVGQAGECPTQGPIAAHSLDRLPRDIGFLLLASGIITGMLPPPPGPFDLSLMLAGGVALWPRGLQAVDDWTGRRFPQAHHAGVSYLERFLHDLERRYPGSTV